MLVSKIKSYFERPFPLIVENKIKWWTSIRIGLFIFLFLYIFQPFQLSNYPNVLSITAGYGFIAFAATAIFLFIIPLVLPHHFQEETWTVKKELIYKVSPVFLIGLANTFYSMRIHLLDSFWKSFFYFEVCTLMVGIFPLTYFVYLIEKRSDKKYRKFSEEIMPPKIIISPIRESFKVTRTIELTAQNGKLEVILKQGQIFYIKSSSNYVEVIYFQESEFQKQLIRNTISNIEKQLQDQDVFYRCHKSYIVNLLKVKEVSGNARGLKIHFAELEENIPVSRKNSETLKQQLSLHQSSANS